jgi:hypothetical protein
LDRVLRPLQSEEVDVEEMRYARVIFQRVLDQLKRRSKVKDPFNCSWGGNFYIIAGDFGNVATRQQLSETFSHPGKCIVGMQKPAGNWIDQSDPARHVRQHFFVEDDLTLELLL